MTAFIVAALRCDRCSAERIDGALDDVDELRFAAILDGWSHVPGYTDMDDLCSSCTDDRMTAAALDPIEAQVLARIVTANNAGGAVPPAHIPDAAEYAIRAQIRAAVARLAAKGLVTAGTHGWYRASMAGRAVPDLPPHTLIEVPR